MSFEIWHTSEVTGSLWQFEIDPTKNFQITKCWIDDKRIHLTKRSESIIWKFIQKMGLLDNTKLPIE